MSISSPGSYIETEVMTAPPQKLQLMLIEAAIRFAKRAKIHREAEENEQAYEALTRAQQVMAELLGGLNREASPKLVGKIASVYVFVFRNLMEAAMEHDVKKIDDAVKVLEVEQETWRRVCQKLTEEKLPLGGSPATIAPQSKSFDTAPNTGPIDVPSAGPTASFSFEA